MVRANNLLNTYFINRPLFLSFFGGKTKLVRFSPPYFNYELQLNIIFTSSS